MKLKKKAVLAVRLGSTLVQDETLMFVPSHDYPISVTTRVSTLHCGGDVLEARAWWRFGSRSFVSVAYSHAGNVAATIAVSRLVGELNQMRGLDTLGRRVA